MSDFNLYFMDLFKLEKERLQELLQIEILKIKERSISEIEYWDKQIERIKSLSREEAIEELLKEINITTKLNTIEKYIKGLGDESRLFL